MAYGYRPRYSRRKRNIFTPPSMYIPYELRGKDPEKKLARVHFVRSAYAKWVAQLQA